MGHISWAIRSIRQFGELFYVEFGFWIWSLRQKVYPVIIKLFFKWVIPGFPQVFWLTLMWVGGNSPTCFWFPLNNSENVKVVTLLFCSPILLETFVQNLVFLTFPNVQILNKTQKGYFGFPDFWSMFYKRKLS